jgi:hypothetical protein
MKQQHVSGLGSVAGGQHINSKSPYVRLCANTAFPSKFIIHSSIPSHLPSNSYYTCPKARKPSQTYTFRRKLNFKMYSLTCFVVLATIFNSSYAKTITIKNQVFSSKDRVQLGNINCAQDHYIFKNIKCTGNARVQLGDIIARGCVPLGGHTSDGITAKDSCHIHVRNHFIRDKVDCPWCENSGLIHEKH